MHITKIVQRTFTLPRLTGVACDICKTPFPHDEKPKPDYQATVSYFEVTLPESDIFHVCPTCLEQFILSKIKKLPIGDEIEIDYTQTKVYEPQ